MAGWIVGLCAGRECSERLPPALLVHPAMPLHTTAHHHHTPRGPQRPRVRPRYGSRPLCGTGAACSPSARHPATSEMAQARACMRASAVLAAPALARRSLGGLGAPWRGEGRGPPSAPRPAAPASQPGRAEPRENTDEEVRGQVDLCTCCISSYSSGCDHCSHCSAPTSFSDTPCATPAARLISSSSRVRAEACQHRQ